MKIYNDDGFVNWRFLYDETRAFCMVVGARAVGKTYGCMKELLQRGVKFLYLRRLKTQLDQCGAADSNPFKKLNADLGLDIQPFRARETIRFCPAGLNDDGRVIPIGQPVALGVALSTFATIRGADFSDFQAIVFDEAVPMVGESPIKNEFAAFLNFYETVNRNRELDGLPPVKCFLMGNANKLSNPYFTGWCFMRTALKMIQGGQMFYRTADNSRIMVMLLNSPISAKKRETALYKNGNNDFVTMALDNAFRTDATNIHSYPLKQCTHIVSVGEIGIYRHKGTGAYYVSKIVDRSLYYDGYGMRLKQFLHDYCSLRILYMRDMIVFESYELQLIFRQYFDLTY